MDRVVYSTTASDILVWDDEQFDVVVWSVEPTYLGKGLCFQQEAIRTPSMINESIRGC